jgi:hypothetical protein
MPISLERINALLTAAEEAMNSYNALFAAVEAVCRDDSPNKVARISVELVKFRAFLSAETTIRIERTTFNRNLKQALKSRARQQRHRGLIPSHEPFVMPPQKSRRAEAVQAHMAEVEEDWKARMHRIDAEDDEHMASIATWTEPPLTPEEQAQVDRLAAERHEKHRREDQ